MKIRILSLTRTVIPYVRGLQPLAQTVAGCVLMQQLDYWFEKKPDGFYKFLEPPEKGHDLYRQGDSWCEELAISKGEFRTAFDRFGIRYKSKSEHDEAAKTDRFQNQYYCSYLDRRTNLTWYFRNHELLDAKLLELFAPGCSIPFTGNDKSSFPANKESQFTGSRKRPSPANEVSSLGGMPVPDSLEVGKMHVPNTEITQIPPKTTHTKGIASGETVRRVCVVFGERIMSNGECIATRKSLGSSVCDRAHELNISEDEAWKLIANEIVAYESRPLR